MIAVNHKKLQDTSNGALCSGRLYRLLKSLFLAWSVKSNVCAINLICSVSVSYFDSSQLILAISEEL